MEMHEALQPVAWLLGTWRGSGRGIYPTIADFSYEEELRFWHSGKPVMAYSSRTWASDDGRALHSEMGYWRPQTDATIEVVIAHSFGLTEIMKGLYDGHTVSLVSVSFEGTPTAKMVDAEQREIALHEDELRYEMGMSFDGNVMQNHLAARLKRSEPS